MQDSCTAAIDIWSVDCIFAELLSMMRENYATIFDRQPLFPDGSCKLLSPKIAGKSEEGVPKEGGGSDSEKEGGMNDELKND